MQFLFQFGHNSELSNLELSTVLANHKIKYRKHSHSAHLVLINPNKPLDPFLIGSQLGGTVRIASLLVSTSQPDKAQESVTNHLASLESQKLTFSLSLPDTPQYTASWNTHIKAALKNKGLSSRFLTPDSDFADPLYLNKNGAQEYTVLSQDNRFLIFHTLYLTDSESWSLRDRGRPFVDAKSGIMPPKISRILVNLSLSSPPAISHTLLDPFCGSGTLLAEAMTLGLNTIGSDLSKQAIDHSQANLGWLNTHTPFSGSWQLLSADAATLDPRQLTSPPTSLATEGYLGPAHLDPANLSATITSLFDLYTRALPHLLSILPSGAKAVFALPKFNHPASVKSLKNLIDTCENSGYTRLAGPIYYSKPQAQIKRAIYILLTK